jgi:hypothetical protein
MLFFPSLNTVMSSASGDLGGDAVKGSHEVAFYGGERHRMPLKESATADQKAAAMGSWGRDKCD